MAPTACSRGGLIKETEKQGAASMRNARGRVQFERQGYFCVDRHDSRPEALVFNRTATLRDTWAKLQKQMKMILIKILMKLNLADISNYLKCYTSVRIRKYNYIYF